MLPSRVCGSVSVLTGGGGTSVGRDVVAWLEAEGGAGEEGFGLGRDVNELGRVRIRGSRGMAPRRRRFDNGIGVL